MIINPKRKEKIESFISRTLPSTKIEIYEWIEFERHDISTGKQLGDCIYVTVNCESTFDRITNGKLCEEISKFFNVECNIDVFRHL